MSQTFSVENFKGVREITLTPSGSLVIVAGGNGAGKSSFIDAFVELFDPRGTRLTPRPIREGEDEARAEFVDTDLGVRIVRTWKKNDAGKLEVFALDGAKYQKPADMVASLTGGLIFDPIMFLNLDEKRQRDALLAKVQLPFDLDEITREKAGAEQRRLEAGREVKRLEGALASLPAPAADTPAEEVSAATLISDLQEARAHNARIQEAQIHTETMQANIGRLEAEIEELQARRDALVTAMRAQADIADQAPVDVAPFEARLASVEDTNARVRAARERQAVESELASQRSAVDAAQRQLDEIDARKRAGLAVAEFPVAGLSVDDDGVTFEGIPFSQVNTAQRRLVAFAIATAGDPKLKLVIVKDGDLLDADSLEAIGRLAEQRGYTVLVERDRDESRRIGFTIEDGALVEAVA